MKNRGPSSELDLGDAVQKHGATYFAIGEFSDVWKGTLHNKEVAVKVLRGTAPSNTAAIEQLYRVLEQEGLRWLNLEHPNVLRFYGLSYDFSYMPALISQYCPNGNIMQYMNHSPEMGFQKRLKLLVDVIKGLEYLHSQGIVHGDIRGSNILINDSGRACLCDFGLTSVIDQSTFTSAKVAGPCRWAAPEVLDPLDRDDPAPFTTASDIFAFGMTMLEVFTGAVPFSKYRNDSIVIFRIIEGDRPSIPAVLEGKQAVWDIIQHCWATVARARPSARHVREWLTEIANETSGDIVQLVSNFVLWITKSANYDSFTCDCGNLVCMLCMTRVNTPFDITTLASCHASQ